MHLTLWFYVLLLFEKVKPDISNVLYRGKMLKRISAVAEILSKNNHLGNRKLMVYLGNCAC